MGAAALSWALQFPAVHGLEQKLFDSVGRWAGGGHRFVPINKPLCKVSSFTAAPRPPLKPGVSASSASPSRCARVKVFIVLKERSWERFSWHYKPLIPDPGSQDKPGLCLTGTGVYGGDFALKMLFPVQIRARLCSGVNQWSFYKVMCYQSNYVWFTSPSICPSGQNQKHSEDTGFVLPRQ